MFLTLEDRNTLYMKMKIIIGPVLRNWIIVIISIETTIGIKGFRISLTAMTASVWSDLAQALVNSMGNVVVMASYCSHLPLSSPNGCISKGNSFSDILHH